MAGHAKEMHEIRLELCRRVVAHIKNGTTDLADGVMLIDVSTYTDPERHDREVSELFRKTPQVVCLSTDLPEPGSYRLFDDTGEPVFVIRGKDGQVRAFLNVCPHRGARLLNEHSGRRNLITCPFHGWTFNAEGHAGRVPQEERFCGLADDHKHLLACPAEERYGLVFVQAAPGSSMNLDRHLGDFAPELEKLDLDTLVRVCEAELPAACNWKYALDTYFENYHFATLHKNSIAPLFLNNMVLYDHWGPHHRIVFPPREAKGWAARPESEWPVDTLGSPYFIFPNTIIYPGALTPEQLFITVFQLYPNGVGGLVTRISSYAPRQNLDNESYIAAVGENLQGIVNLVGQEDYAITSRSWKNFLSMPEGSTILFGAQELGLQNAHKWLAQAAGYPQPLVKTALVR